MENIFLTSSLTSHLKTSSTFHLHLQLFIILPNTLLSSIESLMYLQPSLFNSLVNFSTNTVYVIINDRMFYKISRLPIGILCMY